MTKLLTPGKSNPKTAKGGRPYVAAILHLMPERLAGLGNVCPWASKGCAAACLNTSGRSQVTGSLDLANLKRYGTHRARFERTRRFFEDRTAFLAQLEGEIAALQRRARKLGMRAVVRLNGTSDIPWEHFGIPGKFPDVTFYDYTKSLKRAVAAAGGSLTWPKNYHLTYSRTERDNCATLRDLLAGGVNVAVVFEKLPDDAWGAPVVDGTEHDWRFEDPRGVVVGLLPKGTRGKRDDSGFVIRNA